VAAQGDSGVSCRVTAVEIEAALAAAGLSSLPPEGGAQLAAYVALLLKWNSRLNLTAVREPAEIVRRHLVECVQCAQVLPEVDTLLDFGSGAGLPGVPIAVVRPEIWVTLGESQGKKAAFLREIVRTLGLNAEVFDQRIEKMPSERVFDAVTLRAVDKMAEATREAVHRVRAGGWLVIFATVGTEGRLKPAVVEWERRVGISGLNEGMLLLGRKQ
jgi:16S rRNA (guanine527-N7)-methyltransferase